MLTRVACILITGVLVTPTFTPARELLGAPIIAAGPGHLPIRRRCTLAARGWHGDSKQS
jgi:hypothetical protein